MIQLSEEAFASGLVGEAGILQTISGVFTTDEHIKKFAMLCLKYCNDTISSDELSQKLENWNEITRQNPQNG